MSILRKVFFISSILPALYIAKCVYISSYYFTAEFDAKPGVYTKNIFMHGPSDEYVIDVSFKSDKKLTVYADREERERILTGITGKVEIYSKDKKIQDCELKKEKTDSSIPKRERMACWFDAERFSSYQVVFNLNDVPAVNEKRLGKNPKIRVEFLRNPSTIKDRYLLDWVFFWIFTFIPGLMMLVCIFIYIKIFLEKAYKYFYKLLKAKNL